MPKYHQSRYPRIYVDNKQYMVVPAQDVSDKHECKTKGRDSQCRGCNSPCRGCVADGCGIKECKKFPDCTTHDVIYMEVHA